MLKIRALLPVVACLIIMLFGSVTTKADPVIPITIPSSPPKGQPVLIPIPPPCQCQNLPPDRCL